MTWLGKILCKLNLHSWEFAGITFPTTGAYVRCARCEKLEYQSWL